MSTKFFTWTKGDRRNATDALRAGGVVPIPAEWPLTKAKGRSNWKPPPLGLDQQSCTASSHSSRTGSSIALHDAAVQSATNLMAVMSDMLRSPQLSAHISSQQRSELTPTYARPRSHTAPSTPLVEAPLREVVELPGSSPLDCMKTHLSLPYAPKNSSDSSFNQLLHCAETGATIGRPHTSPQENRWVVPELPSFSSDSLLPCQTLRPPNASETAKPRGTSPYRDLGQTTAPIYGSYEDVTATADGSASPTAKRRPHLSVVQPCRSTSPSFADSVASSNGGSSVIVPRSGAIATCGEHDDGEPSLLEEISHLHASHESHVSCLREAHEKELASHKSYITFLERRKLASSSAIQQEHPHLTIDTSHFGSKTELNSEPSATTIKSLESNLDNHKRASEGAAAEVEALRRKLSLCRKAQGDTGELRRERDHLRDAADRSDRRIVQLKDIMRKAKETERALRNQNADLEARLMAANTERIDVLEGYHDACEQSRVAAGRERRLAQELETIRARAHHSLGVPVDTTGNISPICVDASAPRSKHSRALSDAAASMNTPPKFDPIMRRLTESRRLLAAKDERIKHLELATPKVAESNARHVSAQKHAADLQLRLEHSQKQVTSTQADAERYHSLLCNELRRQARQAAGHSQSAAAPQIEAEAFVVATEKMVRLSSRAGRNPSSGWSKGATSAPLPAEASAAALAATLEKELDHCIKEIIMYKLDVKGYKKDIKNANAEIENLRATSILRPPTPDRDSLSSDRSKRSDMCTANHRAENVEHQASAPDFPEPGLGISLPRTPKTPTRSSSSIAAATAAALSPALTSPTPAPSSRSGSKTPLNAHKELPKPPPASRTPSPHLPPSGRPKWPEQDVKRTETLRSLSESIISSYAKRNEVVGSGAAREEPNSEPLGSMASPGLTVIRTMP